MHASPRRYHGLSIALHWLMLLLIAAVYACIELKGNFPRGSEPRELLKQWHFALGMLVWALVWARLLARMLLSAPPATVAAGWQNTLAAAMHLALYGLMIGLPLLGWLVLSAADKTQVLSFTLPPLLAPNQALAGQLKEIHEWLGVAGYWLIGLHAAAVVLHHYVLRDDTLRRMLPGRQLR